MSRQMERAITVLSGLTPDEIVTLASEGVNNGEDLSAVTFADISAILETASVVKRRKLSHIGNYLAQGHLINDATTMPLIINHLSTPVAPIANNAAQAALPPIPPPDPTRGALRLYVNSIEKYSGSPIDFEGWELKTRVTLGQTAYATFLTNSPVAGDVLQEARNKELYNMFVTALMHGSGMHILNGVPDQDGHAAWSAITAWYMARR
jgi:hypothetical protein